MKKSVIAFGFLIIALAALAGPLPAAEQISAAQASSTRLFSSLMNWINREGWRRRGRIVLADRESRDGWRNTRPSMRTTHG